MTASAPRGRARGFTLIELMIAAAITVVVMAGVVTVITTQQQAYYGGQQQRLSQSSARSALLAIEEHLRLAGFGVDPAFAFDFSGFSSGVACDPNFGATCPVDATDNSDELVFFHRNPDYWVPDIPSGEPRGNAWLITGIADAATNPKFTINARQGNTFLRGQIVQAVCPGGKYYTYAQVNTTVPALGADGSVTLELQAAVSTNPFRRQDLAGGTSAGSGCFSSGLARLFLVDRYRFHVRPVYLGAAGARQIFGPYLVLDKGLTTGAGASTANDELIVAEGVEMIQVSYVLASSALPSQVVGSTPGTAVAFTPATAGALTGGTATPSRITTVLFPGPAPGGQNSVYSTSSYFRYPVGPPANPARNTDHQANIRAVRISVLARSPAADDRGRAGLLLDGTFRLANLDTVPAWIANNFPNGSADDGYKRTVVTSTVSLPNMMTRGVPYF